VSRQSHGSVTRLRAWWLRRQGLTRATAPSTIADCVRRAGWIPTAGSTGVYLSIRARLPGVSRDAIDRAAIDGSDVIEVPGGHARPPVLVPRDEMAVALRLHAASYEKHVAPLFASGAISRIAIREIGAQACRALDEGPLSTGDIRTAITHPDAAELLVGALSDLAIRGIVRRYPVDARLDASKYVYELRHPDDRPDLEAEGDAASVVQKATRLFLQRHGPATVDEIAWWALLTKGAVRKAIAALGAEPISIAGWTDQAWLLPDALNEWKSFGANADDRVVLLPYRDPFVYVRRPPAVLARDTGAPILDPKLKKAAIGAVDSLHHHAVVAAGEIVGVWEYDPDAGRVVTRLWSKGGALGRRTAEAAAETGQFIHRQLGDAKLSAVDPPGRRARRIAFCQQGT
jgi:hypothetical protein